jgi:pimeloyl-ACP methyl ester carboxylesterase
VPGAGGFPSITGTFQRVVEDAALPLVVEHFEWTHGYLRVVADHVDVEFAREQGRRLAERICTLKRECPGRAVYVVGHSAGASVALAAAEALPPGMLDRLVLLAPAVSAMYDVRPALAATSRGMDVYFSYRDWAALGIGTALLGTADRCWGPAAGRVGFWPAPGSAGDALYAKLRQHPWDPCVAWAGNSGGHYGTYQPAFLRAYILPLLSST